MMRRFMRERTRFCSSEEYHKRITELLEHNNAQLEENRAQRPAPEDQGAGSPYRRAGAPSVNRPTNQLLPRIYTRKQRLADLREEEVQRFITECRGGISNSRRRFAEALKEERDK